MWLQKRDGIIDSARSPRRLEMLGYRGELGRLWIGETAFLVPQEEWKRAWMQMLVFLMSSRAGKSVVFLSDGFYFI